MKKIIILLMAVSIMLTSCGKSAGLSREINKVDNKPLATNTSTTNQTQEINNKNNVKQLLTDFLYVNKKARNLTIAAIVVVSFLVIQWIKR
jgi:protein involved in sex pheromone biosynthesis